MIELQTKNGTEYMSVDEFSRWMCFVEAFHFIEKRAEELKIDIEHMIKPNAIEKYITERFPSMKHDVSIEHTMGIV